MTTVLNQQRHLGRTVEQLTKDAAQSKKMTSGWRKRSKPFTHSLKRLTISCFVSSAAPPPWAQAQLDDIQQQLRDQIAVAEASQRSELRAVNRAQKAQAAAVHAARAEAAAETEAAVLALLDLVVSLARYYWITLLCVQQ